MEFRPGRSAGDGSLPDWKTGFERSSPIWSGTATATDGTRSIGRSAHKNRSSPDSSTTSGSNGSTSPTTSAASRSDTVHTPMAGSTGWCFRTRRVMARGRSSTSQRSGSRGRSTWTRERSKTLWTRRSSADSRATIRTRRGNRGSRPRGCATTAKGLCARGGRDEHESHDRDRARRDRRLAAMSPGSGRRRTTGRGRRATRRGHRRRTRRARRRPSLG